MSGIRAYGDTFAAADAFMLKVREPRTPLQALGVMAPYAPQGTSLKENRGTYTVAVVNGKTLDFKNLSFH